jgi:hypothetical protein
VWDPIVFCIAKLRAPAKLVMLWLPASVGHYFVQHCAGRVVALLGTSLVE